MLPSAHPYRKEEGDIVLETFSLKTIDCSSKDLFNFQLTYGKMGIKFQAFLDFLGKLLIFYGIKFQDFFGLFRGTFNFLW